MIGDLTYDEVRNVINNLKQSISVVNDIYSSIKSDKMHHFIENTYKYINFLESCLQINIDADNALQLFD